MLTQSMQSGLQTLESEDLSTSPTGSINELSELKPWTVFPDSKLSYEQQLQNSYC